jgi:hypothetical protein
VDRACRKVCNGKRGNITNLLDVVGLTEDVELDWLVVVPVGDVVVVLLLRT